MRWEAGDCRRFCSSRSRRPTPPKTEKSLSAVQEYLHLPASEIVPLGDRCQAASYEQWMRACVARPPTGLKPAVHTVGEPVVLDLRSSPASTPERGTISSGRGS